MPSGLSRRELLTALLGAPALATLGCGRDRLPLQGELCGQSHRRGHRIRDQDPSIRRKHDGDTIDCDVVIVGGGMAGLAAGWRLHRAGVRDFVVLELEDRVGGTSTSGASSVCGYPWGAHYVPAPDRHNRPLVALFDEMGVFEHIDDDGHPTIAEQFLCRDPQERVFLDGTWDEGLYPHRGASRDDLAQLAAFRQEIDRHVAMTDSAGRRTYTLPMTYGAVTEESRRLDQLSMSAWLRQHGWTSRRLHWYVDHACRDDYGLTSDGTSAWAGIFYFAARKPAPGVVSQPFVTWPEGNGRIVKHLRDQLSAHLRPDHPVQHITIEDETGTEPRAIVIAEHDHKTITWRARRVVFAAPQFVSRHLIPDLHKTQPWRADGFEYGAWLVANVHLSGRPAETGFPLCWDNVLYESPSLGYVVATHQLGIDHGPTVLTWYYPFCDEDPAARRELLLSLDWREWADVVLTDLERAHPDVRDLTTRLDLWRWGHAMIRPRPGFVFSEPRLRAAEPWSVVHFANTDLSAMALMEEAWHHGVRAGEEILAALNVPYETLGQATS